MKQITSLKKTDGGLYELSGIATSGEEKTIIADLDHVSLKVAAAAYLHKCPVAEEAAEILQENIGHDYLKAREIMQEVA